MQPENQKRSFSSWRGGFRNLPARVSRPAKGASRAVIPAALCVMVFGLAGRSERIAAQDARQYFELQMFQTADDEKKESLLEFVGEQHVPAIKRSGINTVGVFSGTDSEGGHSFVFVLIPFEDGSGPVKLHDFLADDAEYRTGIRKWSLYRLEEPPFTSMESRLLKAFAGMPRLELPEPSASKTVGRVFELRLYESHTFEHARKKIGMFDNGEIELMRDTGLGPVFFGETIHGGNMPCLVYMLSASDAGSHRQHWQKFLEDPRWIEMRDKPEYKDTVSRIRSWTLTPAEFSDL
jgi:NIPSNAP